MPKIVDYAEKKYQIMREAVRTFIERGYYNTQLSHIAERCGMGRTTLYQYFKNKDEIFYYAIDYIFGVFRNDYQNIIEEPGVSNLDKIKRIILQVMKECDQKRNMMIVLVDLWLLLKRENETMIAKIREYAMEMHRVFQLLLERGIAAQEIRPVDAVNMAFLLFAMVESFILQVSFNENVSIFKSMTSIEVLLDGLHV